MSSAMDTTLTSDAHLDPNEHPSGDRLYQQAQKTLMDQCESKWFQLKEIQQEVFKATVATPPVGPNAQSIILHTKEVHMNAHVAVLKDSDPEPPPKHPVIQLELLNAELCRAVSEMHNTLALVTTQKKELHEEIQRGNNVSGMLTELQGTLKHKIQVLSGASATEHILMKKLKEKDVKATAAYMDLMKKTSQFTKRHFPLPDRDQVKEWRRKTGMLRTAQMRDNNLRVVSVSDMVEELTNLCLEMPHDPYMTLDHLHWPPYVELLLRSGIALRHPNDDRRIKLVPFHL